MSLRDDYNNNAILLCKPNAFTLVTNVTIKIVSVGINVDTLDCLVYFIITTDL